MLPGLGGLLGRLDDLPALTQGITRIQELGVAYKPFVNTSRLVELLRQIEQQQATRPARQQVAALVQQAVSTIEAAK
ncbi:hypothetical protein [Hymenobacter sp. UYP22]|uniref:hypothetical protein n=1 Tax=Hymenobacter sp. UYP22 TaxID=3156348 RepID=UPI003391D1AF